MKIIGCIRNSLKQTCHQYGPTQDIPMLILIIMAMVSVSLIVGPIHNTLYDTHESTNEHTHVLYDASYAILQSVTVVFAYSVVLFIHQSVTSIYGHLHISLHVLLILHVLCFYLFIQTQNNLLRRLHTVNDVSLRLWS